MIKKFYAATTRECLRHVRDALGANAIILSNRRVEGGVEIIAVADLDVAALTERAEPVVAAARPRASTQAPVQPPPPPPPAARPAAPERPTLESAGPALTTLAEFLSRRESMQQAAKRASAAPAATPSPGPARASASAATAKTVALDEARLAQSAPAAQPADPVPLVEELAREIRLLRGLVEGQLAGFAWSDLTRRDPMHAELMRRLVGAGFSAALSKQVIDNLPAALDLEKALKWVRAALVRNLKVTAGGQDIVEKGGVYALVGPTGVGKTTTVAKLAARAVLKYGADRVALITTDSYRIGAQDQLRIYGRILGTPVYAVRDETDLQLTLADLANKHLVLIDTVGMSQRDRRVAEQASFLSGEGRGVRRILLLGAPAQGLTLEEVVRAYSGKGLFGCILTKIDEALTYGPALDVAIRHQLRVEYVTNGQRVPEDLHLANALYLVDRAFKQQLDASPYAAEDDEIPILAAVERTASLGKTDQQGAVGAVG